MAYAAAGLTLFDGSPLVFMRFLSFSGTTRVGKPNLGLLGCRIGGARRGGRGSFRRILLRLRGFGHASAGDAGRRAFTRIWLRLRCVAYALRLQMADPNHIG